LVAFTVSDSGRHNARCILKLVRDTEIFEGLITAYTENSSDAFRRLRRREEAPEKLAASPRSLPISGFSLAANSFLKERKKLTSQFRSKL